MSPRWDRINQDVNVDASGNQIETCKRGTEKSCKGVASLLQHCYCQARWTQRHSPLHLRQLSQQELVQYLPSHHVHSLIRG